MTNDKQSRRRFMGRSAAAGPLIFGLDSDGILGWNPFGDDGPSTEARVAIGRRASRSQVDSRGLDAYIDLQNQIWEPDGQGGWERQKADFPELRAKQAKFTGAIGLPKVSSTPADDDFDGDVALYSKSDDNIYRKPSGGSESQVGGGGALTDSGNDNADGGNQYQLPAAEDSIDLQSSGDIENATKVDADKVTVNEGSAKVYLGSDQSVGSGSVTTVGFDTENTDYTPGGQLTVDLSNDKITIDQAGEYLINGHIKYKNLSDGSAGNLIVDAGGTHIYSPTYVSAGSADHSATGTVVEAVTSPPVDIKLQAYQDSGSSNDIKSGEKNTSLSIRRIA